MKTAFLLYRPVMDYEESMTAYLIFSTKAKAEAALKAIREYGTKAVDGMPPWAENGETEGPMFDAAFDAREAYLKTLNVGAPYGIELVNSDIQIWSTHFDTGCVEIMELPLNVERDFTPTPTEGKPQ